MDEPLSQPDLKARAATVLWPAFLMAGVLEMLVFAVVDPHQLRASSFDSADWPAGAVYTLAFLLFWAVIAAASAIAVWLCRSGPGTAGTAAD